VKILHLSTSSTGGAGRAAFRMSAALVAYNQESRIMYLGRQLTNSQVGAHPITRGPLKKSMSSALTVLQSNVIQSGTDPVTPFSLNAVSLKKILNLNPDVVHIHNFYNLLSFPSIILLASKAKVVITLHDQRIFTAGCHYSHTCFGYRSNCGSCPQMQLPFQSLASRLFEKNMHDLRLDHEALTLVSPSEWLLSKARENVAFSRLPGYVIRNPIPTYISDAITPQQNSQLRIGFCSDKLNNPLKGLTVLLNAVSKLKREYVLRLIGSTLGDLKIPSGINYELISPTTDVGLTSELANLDVLVVPSLEDNSPNVIGEALMCGTKVVGSDIGGIGELMRQTRMDSFQPTNPNELTRILMGFQTNYSRSDVIDSARGTFSYQVIAPQIMDVYGR
jgi:glycosyltransferase involved in cell wall biosynthesis